MQLGSRHGRGPARFFDLDRLRPAVQWRHPLSGGLTAVAKPELGTKRVCASCGAKFYDLARDPIVCPKCGTVYQIVTSARAAAPAAAARVAPAPARPTEEVD